MTTFHEITAGILSILNGSSNACVDSSCECERNNERELWKKRAKLLEQASELIKQARELR